MKTIVVPTDFSECAGHACLYAAQLAKTINASVLLLHVYQIPVTMSDFPVLIISAEELKQNADEGLRRAKEEMQKAMPGVHFETESRMGDVVEEIKEACLNREVVALVAGTQDMSGFERFLLGNTALSIVKHCEVPAIAVPQGSVIKVPAKVVVAIDDDDIIPADKIREFIQLLGAELHIVHVETGEGQSPNLPDAFKDAKYHSLKEDDVARGIHDFVEKNNVDLVVILPHKHNLIERIFFKGHTKELINVLPIPVLCIR